MNSSRFFAALAVAGSIVMIASCSKTHDMVAHPSIVTPSGLDTVTIGDTLVFKPVASNDAGSTFTWYLGTTQVSTDSGYTFTATARGDYQVQYIVANAAGSTSVVYRIHVYGKYENGYFLSNEGSYGASSGSLSFYRYNTGTLEDSVYTKVNAGKDLGPNTSEVEFGTVYNNKLYLLTKAGGPLVQADAFSLAETGRIATNPGNDFRALLPIDTSHALVSTGNGIFPLNLQTMTLGTALTSVTGEADDMTAAGSYIFVLDGNGLDVLNSTTYAVVKNVPNVSVGFAVSMDGGVWAAGDSALIRIDPASLDTSMIALPFGIDGTFGFWHAGSMAASTTEDAVFIANNASFFGATTIYKYIVGMPASVATPFINIASGKQTYGKGIGYDPARNQLVVTTVDATYALNDLDTYDAGTGALTNDVNYSGYFFPSMPFFH